MRVLLTGGAGFIGSHAAARLTARGDDVMVVDDLNDFYAPELKRQNLRWIGTAGTFEFVQLDVRDADRIARTVADFHPDTVIHLAARAGVRPSLADPLLYEQVNVGGVIALLEACRRLAKPPRFVFASSSSVYGARKTAPFRESDPVQISASPYAATKLAAENFCAMYSTLYGIPAVCLRLFTVYGPRQRPDLAVRKFTEAILNGLPVPMFGDGSTGRDYTYVDDIVEGLLAASTLNCNFETINLGNSTPVTLSALIHTLEKVCGREAKIQRLPEQLGDVPLTCADISKAERVLGWRPAVSFTEGIRLTVEWMRACTQTRTA